MAFPLKRHFFPCVQIGFVDDWRQNHFLSIPQLDLLTQQKNCYTYNETTSRALNIIAEIGFCEFWSSVKNQNRKLIFD